jgi:hypothetical protein
MPLCCSSMSVYFSFVHLLALSLLSSAHIFFNKYAHIICYHLTISLQNVLSLLVSIYTFSFVLQFAIFPQILFLTICIYICLRVCSMLFLLCFSFLTAVVSYILWLYLRPFSLYSLALFPPLTFFTSCALQPPEFHPQPVPPVFYQETQDLLELCNQRCIHSGINANKQTVSVPRDTIILRCEQSLCIHITLLRNENYSAMIQYTAASSGE